MASAGATLPAGLAHGLLYEVMQVTTPTGWRTATAPKTPARPIGPASLICGEIASSTGSRAPFAYRRKRAAPTATCMDRAVPVVAPLSARASAALAAKSRCIRSAARSRIAARSSGRLRDQTGNASRAAAAAAYTCSRLASGARPTACSVAGLITS